MSRIKILARARPLDKFRMVRLLQDQGHVVAVTGDGTNDAPALKKADVGLAMGIAGTEVAKEASKIVLLDDSFATIVSAVHWGRSLYENIQRFIQFQLTINVSALAIAFLGPFIGVKPPFTVLQLLWINVIMDTFAAIALCSEPPRPGLMSMRPKRRDESIVNRSMMTTILTTGVFYVVVMLTLLIGMEYGGWFRRDVDVEAGAFSKEFPELTLYQVALFFTVYVLFQVWNAINCRSLTPDQSGLKGVLQNTTFLGIMAAILIGQFVIVTVGGRLFEVQPLGPLEWLLILAGTSSVLIFAEVARQFRRSAPAA
jgi:Ca2+-transporting ATPase